MLGMVVDAFNSRTWEAEADIPVSLTTTPGKQRQTYLWFEVSQKSQSKIVSKIKKYFFKLRFPILWTSKFPIVPNNAITITGPSWECPGITPMGRTAMQQSSETTQEWPEISTLSLFNSGNVHVTFDHSAWILQERERWGLLFCE